MPLYDFIKGILGLPSPERSNYHSHFKKPLGIGGDDDDDDDIDQDDIIIIDDYRDESPFGFNVFSGNISDMHRHFQKQMEDIMKTFASPWFNDSHNGSFSDFGNMQDPVEPKIKEDTNPRNRFLKPSPGSKNIFDVPIENDSNDVEIARPRSSTGFSLFSGDPLEIHKFFEQQIDDIFKKFSASSWFFPLEGNMLELPEESPGRVEEYPRNRFFKPSYEQSRSIKPDSDIDNESYASKVVGKLLEKEPAQPPSSSIISRSIMTTHQRKMLPNGGIEEKRKCIRDGKEEITVSRQIGDRKHIITIVKSPDGTKTKNEEFINLDEGQLGEFYRSWNKM